MKQKTTFIICLLFGLMFINAGLNKFLNYMPVPDDLPEEMIKMWAAIMEIRWLYPLVAVTEIIGGRLIRYSKIQSTGCYYHFLAHAQDTVCPHRHSSVRATHRSNLAHH